MQHKFLLIIYLLVPFEIFSLEDENLNLNILVYNTHGLPEIFIDDNPKMRFPIIGEKTQDYNISLLQEDYSHHEELSSGLSTESIASRGGMGTFLCPFCTGSGLTSIFNLPESWLIDVENETYKDCSGWLRGANDYFAYKGFQVIKSPLQIRNIFISSILIWMRVEETHTDMPERNN